MTDTPFDDKKRFPYIEKMDTIGSGTFGSCYLLKQTKPKKSVRYYALKVIKQERIDYTKFEREREALSKINFGLVCSLSKKSNFPIPQPNFPNPQQNYLPCLLLDYIPGTKLYDYIEQCDKIKKDIKPSFLYKLSWGIAYALQQIHKARVIHRDISTTNIIIDGNFFPHIVDLGESTPSSRDSTRHIHGTIYFLPPETQQYEQEYNFSPEFDIFSLGAVIYNMITREFPFQDLLNYCAGYTSDKPPYDFKKELDIKYIQEFDAIKTSYSQDKFQNALLDYITNEKRACMKYYPSPDNDFFNKLFDWQKGLMKLVYKCFKSEPEKRPSAEEVANEILSLAETNLKGKDWDEFFIFYEIVKENALPKHYGDNENVKLALDKLGSEKLSSLFNSECPYDLETLQENQSHFTLSSTLD